MGVRQVDIVIFIFFLILARFLGSGFSPGDGNYYYIEAAAEVSVSQHAMEVCGALEAPVYGADLGRRLF